MAIKGLILENIDKAKAQADSVKESAESSILTSYAGNTSQLTTDLSSVGDKKVYYILQESIKGKYLNVKNDNNDMWVWIPLLGKVADTSHNCAFQLGESVTIDGEVAKQNDPVLCRIAINSIVNQENKKFIFWNYLKTPEGYYIPLTMDEAEIDKLFNLYGVDGLSRLEFLVPSYLRQDEDILGVPDVNYNGVKTNNNKIIFVQGFNIVDDLQENHADLLRYYDDQLSFISEKYESEITNVIALGVAVSIILFIGFLCVVQEINRPEQILT